MCVQDLLVKIRESLFEIENCVCARPPSENQKKIHKMIVFVNFFRWPPGHRPRPRVEKKNDHFCKIEKKVKNMLREVETITDNHNLGPPNDF